MKNTNRLKNIRMVTRRTPQPLRVAIALRNKNNSILNISKNLSNNRLKTIYNNSGGKANSIYNRLMALKENSGNSPAPSETMTVNQSKGKKRGRNINNNVTSPPRNINKMDLNNANLARQFIQRLCSGRKVNCPLLRNNVIEKAN